MAAMRTLRVLLNPMSTRATEWWCHSTLRRLVIQRTARTTMPAAKLRGGRPAQPAATPSSNVRVRR